MRSFLMTSALAFVLFGCDKPVDKQPVDTKPVETGKVDTSKPATGTTPAVSPVATATDALKGAIPAAAGLEVGCAHCLYKVAGVTACAPAVNVAGKHYVITGAPVDMAKANICAAPKKATIEGKIEGDKYVATKVEIK